MGRRLQSDYKAFKRRPELKTTRECESKDSEQQVYGGFGQLTENS